MPVTPNLFKSTDFVVGASGQINVSNPDGVTRETVATFNEPPKTLLASTKMSPKKRKTKKSKPVNRKKRKSSARKGKKNKTMARIRY